MIATWLGGRGRGVNDVRSYFCKIDITLIAKVALRVAKKGHKNMIRIFNTLITKIYVRKGIKELKS